MAASNNLPGAKLRKLQKKKTSTYDYWANGRAFSGFRHLCSLTLLGLSNLDCLGEICDCLKGSSTTLRSLTLSLSSELARKARQPSISNPQADDATDSDPEGEDEDEMNDPQLPNSTSSGHVNEADIRKEKLAQEAILPRIFDLQGVAAEGKRLEKNVGRPIASRAGLLNIKANATIASGFQTLLKILLHTTYGDIDANAAGREALDTLQKAAAEYLAAHPPKGKKTVAETDKQATSSAGNKMVPKAPKPFEQGFLFGNPTGKVEVINSGGASKDWIPNPTNDGWAPNETPTDLLSGLKGKSGFGAAGSYVSPFDPGFPVPLPTSNSSTQPSIFANQGTLTPTWGSSKNTYNPEGIPKIDYTANFDWNLVKSLDQSFAESQLDKIQNFDNYKGPYDFDSEEESEPAKGPSFISKTQVFPASEVNGQDQDDSMDIDMEHPDENTIEVGPDQEIIAEPEEKEPVPRKRARFAVGESSSESSVKELDGGEPEFSAGKPSPVSDNMINVKSPDEEMREYIRATHGLQLEELSLYLIPLRASILARALDLNLLRRITLLSVGSQDPFWLLLTKLQRHSTHISFDSIHTDHVSLAFLEFLKMFEGLQELFMLERSNKNEPDSGFPKANVSITSIRKLALNKHIRTLHRLMIKNENDESWDLDAKTIRFLSSRGSGLTELAVSLNMKHYVSSRYSARRRETSEWSNGSSIF